MNADLLDKEDFTQLVTNEVIEGTPLRIVGAESTGYFVALGKYRVSEYYVTQEKAKETAEQKGWQLITNIIGVMIEIARIQRINLQEEE